MGSYHDVTLDRLFVKVFPKVSLEDQIIIMQALCGGDNYKSIIHHPLTQKWVADNATNMARITREA